jgi:hypothetical protein
MSERHPLDEQPWQPIVEKLRGFNPFSNDQNPTADPFPSSVLDALDALDEESDEESRRGNIK